MRLAIALPRTSVTVWPSATASSAPQGSPWARPGREYRVGYSLGVLGGESLAFELCIDDARHESPGHGGADHGVQGRLTAHW